MVKVLKSLVTITLKCLFEKTVQLVKEGHIKSGCCTGLYYLSFR